jgi:hypothetical protein
LSIQKTPNMDVYFEELSAVIKSFTPKIDTSTLLNPLIESLKPYTNLTIKPISLSFQPLLDYMDEINKEISSMSSIMSNMLLDSLKNFKTITSYTAETIESISKFALTETIDDVYDSLDELEFNDEIISLVTECKNEIISIKNDLNNSKSKEIDIHQWIATITALIGLILSILSQFDNSNEILIEQNKQIIEIESSKLQKLESIDNSLEKLVKSVE